MAGNDSILHPGDLTGRWVKSGGGPAKVPYPDDIEFHPDGSYRGSRGLGGGDFTIWDVGEYRIVEPGRVRISTATDRRIVYEYGRQADELTFTDPDGVSIVYRRAAE
jgi:hypothetical protein